MGKRELLLIVTFLVVGMGVYQVTAPAAKPGQQGFSFTRLFNLIKSELHGENAEAKVVRQASQPIDASIERLLLPDYRGRLVVIGEDRADVAAHLVATTFGIDEATAQARANEIVLGVDTSGDQAIVRLSRPEQSGRTRAAVLTLRVPARLVCELEFRGEAEVRDVAGLQLLGSRGKLLARDIGDVEGEFRNGGLELSQIERVDLKTQRTEIRIDRVAKSLALEAEHGPARLQRIGGPTTLKLNRVECEAEGLAGESSIHTEHGRLTLRAIAAPVEITADQTRLELIMSAAVPVTATTSGEELAIELPDRGVTLDAEATDGRVRLLDHDEAVEAGPRDDEKPDRVAMPIGGGGPTVRLRNEHADIIVRRAGGKGAPAVSRR